MKDPSKFHEGIEAALDRLEEAHFFLHGLEEFYHFATQFRWHLNAFLRPLKEVPQLVTMSVQNDPELVEWHRTVKESLMASSRFIPARSSGTAT